MGKADIFAARIYLRAATDTYKGDGGPEDGRREALPDEEGQYLVFKEGRFTLALGIKAIKRLYDAESFPPRTPSTRMIDLHDLVGAESKANHVYWIEMEIGDGRYLMPVEEVEGIGELSLAVVLQYPGILRRPQTAFLKRMFFDGLRMIVELDPEALAATTEGIINPYRHDSSGGGEASENEEARGSVKAPDADANRMVILEIGGRTWRLALDLVAQIVNREEIHAVPASGRKIMGVVYHQDQAIPVISPGRLVETIRGDRFRSDGEFSMIIVAETKKGLIGFGCDRIIKVAERSEDNQEAGQDQDGPASSHDLRAGEIDPDVLVKHL